MTTNNAPEMIASNNNNNSFRAPAAFTLCIPSPKAWTSYTFKQRSNPEETQLPTGANNDHKDRQGVHIPSDGGPPPLEGRLLPVTAMIMEEDLI